MATTFTSQATTNFSDTVVVAVIKRITENLRAGLPWLPQGVVTFDTQKVGESGTFRHTAYADFGVAGNLVEGTPIDPANHQEIGIFTEDFAVVQKGAVTAITDLAALRSPHNLLRVAVELSARQAALTQDEVAKSVWAAGSVHPLTLYADATATQTNAAKTDVLAADVLQARDIRRAVAYLASINVPRIGGRMGADGQAHGGHYLAIASPRALAALKTETAAEGWLDTAKYADPGAILTGEIGMYYGCRFIETTRAIIDEDGGNGGTVPVEQIVVTGANALAFADVNSLQASFVPPAPSAFDPLGQVAYVGFKQLLGGLLIEGAELKPRCANIWASAPVLA